MAIFKDNTRVNDYGFRSDMRVENLFTISYKSRYFLELLQNSRDAIVESGITDGKVKVWTDRDTLYFANNGAEFTEEGIWSICYPAISTKTDLNMVGHKGIGFNAIREISVKPRIHTRFGTIFFDVDAASVILNRQNPNLPLFRYPMFDANTVSDRFPNLSAEGYSTVFQFPLIDGLQVEDLDLGAPKIEDMIFLSAIKELQIEEKVTSINDDDNPIIVQHHDGERLFKKYTKQFEVSDEEIETFTEDERSQFKNSRKIECSLLLEVDKNRNFCKTDFAALHLFYGLDFVTGFSFSLHSYFSVTLERKSLVSNSKLNELLYQQIAAFFTTDFLNMVKRDFPGKELSVLAFARQSNNRMSLMYDLISDGLMDKDFIYHPELKRYFRPDEIVISSSDDYEVFRDGELGGKVLLKSSAFDGFLTREMKVAHLGSVLILEGMEAKCEQFQSDPSFFEDLYGLVFTKKINASDKQILLTASGNLVSGSVTDTFYQVRNKLVAPEILESDIAFLHADIELENIRSGLKKFLGIIEFNEATLFKRAVKILIAQDSKTEAGQQLISELLHFIVQFDLSDLQQVKLLKNAIVFPIINSITGIAQWKRPTIVPTYFEDFALGYLYKKGFFTIDYKVLGIAEDERSNWKVFLLKMGIWEIPGVFILESTSAENTPYPEKEILNNPTFHLPDSIDETFFTVVTSSWNEYEDFISEDRGRESMGIDGVSKLYQSDLVSYSNVVRQLRELRWLPATRFDERADARSTSFASPLDVVMLGISEWNKNHNSVIFDFFSVCHIDRSANIEFVKAFEIVQLQPNSIEECVKLLEFFHNEYPVPSEVENQKGLKNLSNRLLTFIYEFLNKNNQVRNNDLLKKQLFLAEGIMDGRLVWLPGAQCLHIDDKNFLDVLIENDLLESLSDPYAFTKKDKKEWGKFGNKIGRSVRKMVKTQLISEGTKENLFSNVKYPAVLLAFVENDLESNYKDDQILAFNEVECCVHEHLEMSYSLEEKTHKVLQSYYVTEGKTPMLHISRDCISNKHLFAQALAEWVDSIVGRELIRFYLIIERILESKDHQVAINYAVDHDIDEQRVIEILNLLTFDYYFQNDSNDLPVAPQIPLTTSKPSQIRSSVVNVTLQKQEISLDIQGQLANYFDMLEGKVSEPTYGFSPRTAPEIVSEPAEPTFLNSSVPSIRIAPVELDDKGKTDIGFLAELFVYLKLQAGEKTMLNLLGLDVESAKSVEWLNLHRRTNYTLPDRSRGHGYDFILKVQNLAIEVKGMMADTGYINLTGKELDSMRYRGEKYFLVVVKHVLNGSYIPTVIQNPYQKLVSGELYFFESKIIIG